jgi:hypothetical protein
VRIREIDEREADVEAREARAEADIELRLDKLERREEAVASTEERLAKKERDLSEYVGQVQAQLERRDSDWWEKQLGERPAALSG